MRSGVTSEQNAELNQLISAARSAMHAVKSLKDIESNINDLKRSSTDLKYNLYSEQKTTSQELYSQLNALLIAASPPKLTELQQIFTNIQDSYSQALTNFYKEAQVIKIEDLDITTVINFNRELFTSHKAIFMAIKDYLLQETEAEKFNQIPVYKT